MIFKKILSFYCQTFIALETMHYCSIPQWEMLYIVICSQKCGFFFCLKINKK